MYGPEINRKIWSRQKQIRARVETREIGFSVPVRSRVFPDFYRYCPVPELGYYYTNLPVLMLKLFVGSVTSQDFSIDTGTK